jgi:1-acyl-sn-glycerol-3-phosphate acyltransferase
MSPNAVAAGTLVAYATLLCGLVIWRAIRCPRGWRLWLLYLIAALYCRLCFRWRSNGKSPFDAASPALVIANHRSPLDPLLIWVGVTNWRPLEFLTAKEYFGIPGLQFIFENMRAIPVARDGHDLAATRMALRRLKEGCLVGVFPEGGIRRTRDLAPGNPGTAWLALQSKAPVYPVYIENAPQSESMVAPFLMFNRVHVRYGERINLDAYYGRRTTPELLEEVTDLLMQHVAQLGGVGADSCRTPAATPEAPLAAT